MKKLLSTFLLLFLCSTLYSQKLYKSKSQTLSEIQKKGFTYAEGDSPNQIWYIRYDKYGKAMVQLTFENNILRKAVFAQKDARSPLNRMMDLFVSISREEALEFDVKYGKTTNTEYFSGKALFKVSDTYIFTIIPLY